MTDGLLDYYMFPLLHCAVVVVAATSLYVDITSYIDVIAGIAAIIAEASGVS